jgi:hypothetical protein
MQPGESIVKFSPLKAAAFAIVAIGLCGSTAFADTIRDVKCANGRTVQASGTQSNAQACATIASQPSEDAASGLPTGKRQHKPVSVIKPVDKAGNDAKAKKYQQLAASHKPKTAQQEQLIKQYMKLPPSQRAGFKAANPGVQESIWDYGPYAVCFYASVAGGADVVEAGDECHADWVE